MLRSDSSAIGIAEFDYQISGVVASSAVVVLTSMIALDSITGVVYGRGDYVATTGPLSQIQQPATLTAEREVRIGPLDPLLARGALHFDGTFARHNAFWA